ncbi:MAG: AAA family ATPase [Dysgonamonadaceae bacterium]|jgi:predicted ATP-dependent endonuclease of OLD family|nr:AAA family ATPase [Dysgonamonadaceae bacterium]
MYISNLSIRNYRNFRNVSLSFQKGVNTIIGENGSGKTNILQALRLLIDESLPRSVRFYESDFNRTLNSWKGHWIIIQIEFEELDVSEEAQAIAMHKAGEMAEYESSKGSYSLIFRPRENKRRELYEYSLKADKNQEELQEIINSIGLNDYEYSYRGRGNVDFSIDENYLDYVGNFNNISFPNPDEQRDDVYGTKLFGFSIPNELSCTFVKALRDVESDLRSFKDNPLLNLLRGKEKSIDVAQKESIGNKVESLNQEISNLDEVKDVTKGISLSIKRAVGETYAPNIDIKSELPSDMERLLQSLKLWVGDPDEIGYKGRIWELSLGGANLIYLSLKLLEYEKVKSLDKIANFLLIEEPEAHIHTHIQKTLFQKLQSHNTQIIITTHSTHISSVSEISAMNVLSRINKQAVVFNPSNGLNESQIQALERYLDAVRTNLLFAKGIILVEGDAEQIIIPHLIKKVFGVSLDELGISLVNIGSTGFDNIAILFHNDRVRKKCAIITDLDQSILPLPDDESTDSAEQRNCRNSQKSGTERKQKLNDFVRNNFWIAPFYAEYTFEVDFLLAGNSFEVCKVVNEQYTIPKIIETISEKLNNSDVSIAGKEILRLANKFGKGWFAIMLSKQIDHLTNVPEYIINAIAHTSLHINDKTLLEMANFRLQSLSKKSYEEDKTDYNSIIALMQLHNNPTDALNVYKEKLPNDILSNLINGIEIKRLL